MFDLLPVTIAMLMGEAKQHDISLLAEILGLLHYVDDHLLNRPLIRSDLLLYQLRCLPLEGVNCLSAVELTLDVIIVVQGVKLLEEYFQVLFNLFGILGANVPCYVLALLTRVHLERLAYLLVITTVPVEEP